MNFQQRFFGQIGTIIWHFNQPKQNSNSTHFIPGGYKALQLVVRQAAEFNWQVEIEVRAPCSHEAITPKGCCRRLSKDLNAKPMARLFGQRLVTAFAGWTGNYKHGPKQDTVAAGHYRFALERSAAICNTDSVGESRSFEYSENFAPRGRFFFI